MAGLGSATAYAAALRWDAHPPVALTGLLGRDRELTHLVDAVHRHRLVTVTGPGGSGKTRLCIALAERLRGDGEVVTWAGLESVSDRVGVAASLAASLGARPTADEDVLAAAARLIGAARRVLVVDTCEHVLDPAGAAVQALLQGCRELRIVATSRAVLGVAGEVVHRLDGLSVDDSDGRMAPALELFVERARARLPDFGSAADLRDAAMLCRRLDGLPLAVELAAARVDVLSVNEIVSRMGHGVRVLSKAGRGPARHGNLEAALSWSHDLLTPEQQAVLRRLSVFRGTFSLPVAEAVVSAASEPRIAREDVVDHIGVLIDQSLVQVQRHGDEPRYRLLDTVAAYTRPLLLGHPDERGATEQAHADAYALLATQADAGQSGPDQYRWLARLELEQENLREALHRSLVSAEVDPGRGTRLVVALWPFWYRHGHYAEARRWLDAARRVAGQSDVERSQILLVAGTFAFLQCDYPAAESYLDQVAELAVRLQDRRIQANVVQRRGALARETARYDDARRHHQTALDLWRELGNPREQAISLDHLAFTAWMEGDLSRAESEAEQAVAAAQLLRGQQEQSAAIIHLAGIRVDQQRADEARPLLNQARDLAVRLGYREGLAWVAHLEGLVHLAEGDRRQAVRSLAQSLAIHVELGDWCRTASVLESLSVAVTRAPAPPPDPDAIGFVVAAQAIRERIGAPVPAVERPRMAALRELLGPISAVDAPSVTDLVARAESLAKQRRDADASAGHQADFASETLTQRELAVLSLICQGMTNREIGATLFISPSTAGVHVSNILHKIGASNRAHAAAIANAHNFDGVLTDRPSAG